jgi:hypothetical protein
MLLLANFMKTSSIVMTNVVYSKCRHKTLIYSCKNYRPLFLSCRCLRESILLCQVHIFCYCRTYCKMEQERLQPHVSRPCSTNDLGGIYVVLTDWQGKPETSFSLSPCLGMSKGRAHMAARTSSTPSKNAETI